MFQPSYDPFQDPARRSWRNWSSSTWILILLVAGFAGWFLYTRLGGGSFSLRNALPTLVEHLIAPGVVLLAAMPVHEFAHAATAVWLGDETPRQQGRLTLNPLRHLDLVGTILLLTVGMGWAKPVQWNPAQIRTDIRLGTILVAAAGPLSNIVLAFVGILLWQQGVLTQLAAPEWAPIVLLGARVFIYINLVLAVFNLIPVPPLDGSHILFALLPAQFRQLQFALTQYGILVILAVLWFAPNLIRGLAGTLFLMLETLAQVLTG